MMNRRFDSESDEGTLASASSPRKSVGVATARAQEPVSFFQSTAARLAALAAPAPATNNTRTLAQSQVGANLFGDVDDDDDDDADETSDDGNWGKWNHSEDEEKEMRASLPVARSASNSAQQALAAKSAPVVSARMKRAFASWQAAGKQIPKLSIGAAARALAAGEEVCVDEETGGDAQLDRAKDEYGLLLAERQKALLRYAIGNYRGSRAMRDRAADDLDTITDMLARLFERDASDFKMEKKSRQEVRRVLDAENALAIDEARSILEGNRVIIADDLVDLYLRNEGDMIGAPGTNGKAPARATAERTSLQNAAALLAPALGVPESEAARRWKKNADAYTDAVRVLAAQGESSRFDAAADAAVAKSYGLGLDMDVRSSAFIRARYDTYDDRRYLAYSPDGAVCDGPVCGDADADECADDYDPCCDPCGSQHHFKYVVVHRSEAVDRCKDDEKKNQCDLEAERKHEERVRELQRRIAQLEKAQNDAQRRELDRCRAQETERRAQAEQRSTASTVEDNDCDYRWVWETEDACGAVEAPQHACPRPLCENRFASMMIPAGVRLSGPSGNGVDSEQFAGARDALADFVESTRLMSDADRSGVSSAFAASVWQSLGRDASVERHAFSTLMLYMLQELFDIVLCNKSCRALILASDIAVLVRQLADGKVPRPPASTKRSDLGDRAAALVVDYLTNGPRIAERSDRFELTQRDAPFFLNDNILYPRELVQILGSALGVVSSDLSSLRAPHGNFVRAEWQTVAQSMQTRLGPLLPKPQKQATQPPQSRPQPQQQPQRQPQQQPQSQPQQPQRQPQQQPQPQPQQPQPRPQQQPQRQPQQPQREPQQPQQPQRQPQQPQRQPASPTPTPAPSPVETTQTPAQAEIVAGSDSEASDEFEEPAPAVAATSALKVQKAGAQMSDKHTKALSIMKQFATQKAKQAKAAQVPRKKTKDIDLASIIAGLKK